MSATGVILPSAVATIRQFIDEDATVRSPSVDPNDGHRFGGLLGSGEEDAAADDIIL
jgi:hypothetical protein